MDTKKRGREDDQGDDDRVGRSMSVLLDRSKVNQNLTIKKSQRQPRTNPIVVPTNPNLSSGFSSHNMNSSKMLSSLASDERSFQTISTAEHEETKPAVKSSIPSTTPPRVPSNPPKEDEDYEYHQENPVQATVEDGKVPTLKPRKLILQKYTIYRTEERMIIMGSNNRETMFRILEIDLTDPAGPLSIVEDNVYFSRKEMAGIIKTLEQQSKNLTKVLACYGLLGFVRFTHNYYLHTVTERLIVGILGGHYIYKIDSTQLVPVINEANKALFRKNSTKQQIDNEQRFISIYEGFSLDQNFYYSYTYDVTNTLQKNFLSEKYKAFRYKAAQKGDASRVLNEYVDGSIMKVNEESSKYLGDYNEMFVWNVALLKPAVMAFDRTFDWFQPIIHGFFNQANISVYNKKVYVTLIARRSHHFAGARFLKRGVNDKGNVANEVETEQIVSDGLTTSFHSGASGYYMNPGYTSFVQHRGSIPLFWTQDTNVKISKPPISMTLVDPFYSVSALHFDKLFRRYGSKIFILNLIKQKEKTARESLLGKEFKECVEVLNTFLPPKHKLDYVAWDMSRASKASKHGQAVLEYLESYLDRVIKELGIFHNALRQDHSNLQNGICRTNCIDCLDRTNMAQFILGKKALGHQLKQLGIHDNVFLEYDSDAVNLLTELFHNHGNIIALQYGGSNLVNTMETYRKINQWSSKKNDLIENMKRFYLNSFVDPLRQDSINLFLGNYDYARLGKHFLLWDLPSDYYLHNEISSTVSDKKRSFCLWWNERALSLWDNMRFPPKGYLSNGEKNTLNENEYRNTLNLLLDELVISSSGEIAPKLYFGERKTLPKDIKLCKAVIKRWIKEYTGRYLEPYPGKQMDSYWVEYYTPRKLTNFKLLFDMNIKSSIGLDPKELSGAKFSEDIGDAEKESFEVWEGSPFTSRVPGFINLRFKKMYPESLSEVLRKATKKTNMETQDFVHFLWPESEEDDDDKVDEEGLLRAQLRDIMSANNELVRVISEEAACAIDGPTPESESQSSDISNPFMSELFDIAEEPSESFDLVLEAHALRKNITYSGFLSMLPGHLNLPRFIKRERPSNEIEQAKSTIVPRSGAFPVRPAMSRFDDYLFNPISSIRNLKLYDDNVKFEDDKRVVSSESGTDDRVKKLYGDDTVIYHDVDDKLSIISDFYIDQSTMRNANSLLNINEELDEGALEESSAVIDQNNYEGEAIVINPELYEIKSREYTKLLPGDSPIEVAPRDLEMFRRSVSLAGIPAS